MKEKSLTENIIFNVIKTLVTVVFPVITYMYSARIFLSEGVGQINFAKSYTAYFSILAMLGIVGYATREAAKLRDDSEALSHFAHEVLMINCISVLASYGIFFLSILGVGKLQGYWQLLLINCPSIALTAFGMEWLYSAMEDYKYITIRTCVFSGISLVAVFLFVRDAKDIYIYALIQMIAAGGSNVMNLLHSRKYIHYTRMSNYRPLRHLRPVLVLFSMTLFIQVFTHLDTTMLGFIAGNAAVGYYTAANRMCGMVSSVITAVTVVLTPRIAYYTKSGDQDEIRKLTGFALNIILLLAIPMALGLALLSEQIILIFSGRGFSEAIITGRILSLRTLLVPINSFMVLHLFIPLQKEKWNLISTSAAAVLNLCMNWVLIPIFAQNGAAIGTICAEGIECVINLFFLSKILDLKNVFAKTWQCLLAGLGIIVPYFILKRFALNDYLFTATLIAISAPAYFSLLYLFGNHIVREGVDKVLRKAGIDTKASS